MSFLLTDRALRLVTLERMMRRPQGATMAAMREATGASLATVKRDISALRDDIGLPFVTLPKGYGYVYLCMTGEPGAVLRAIAAEAS